MDPYENYDDGFDYTSTEAFENDISSLVGGEWEWDGDESDDYDCSTQEED